MPVFSRRKLLIGSAAAIAVLPLQPVSACLGAEFHRQITFESIPDDIPAGLTARYFHLTNQVPEFDEWQDLREIDLMEPNVLLRHSSLIGVGAIIDPWTHWLSKYLPEWISPKPSYMPVFASTGSCTRSFSSRIELDETVVLVGKRITLANGKSAFVASSYLAATGYWEPLSRTEHLEFAQEL